MFEAEPLRHRDRELIGRERAALEQHLPEQLTRLGRHGDRVLNRGAIAEPEVDDDVAQPFARLLHRAFSRYLNGWRALLGHPADLPRPRAARAGTQASAGGAPRRRHRVNAGQGPHGRTYRPMRRRSIAFFARVPSGARGRIHRRRLDQSPYFRSAGRPNPAVRAANAPAGGRRCATPRARFHRRRLGLAADH